MSVNGPATYKQPSRKGKKAWRKNVDVTEVEAGLKELQEEIITGGVIAEKSNDQLFTLDISGDKSIIRKEFKQKKTLKCDEILNTRSAVPAVSSRKRYPDRGDMLTDGTVPEKKKIKNWVSFNDAKKLKAIAYGQTQMGVVKKSKGVGEFHDPWAEQKEGEEEDQGKLAKFSFIEKAPELKPPPTLKHAPVSLLASGKPAPAIRIPKGAISYNPHFDEWDEELRKEGDKEVEKGRKRLREEQVERERLEHLAKEEEEERRKEAEGAEEADEEASSEDGEAGGKDGYLKKRAVRKTRVQRNKEQRRKEAERLKLILSQQKRQRQQLEELKRIKNVIEARENARLEALALTADDEGDSEKAQKIRRRKLGKNHLPPRPLELQLPDELPDSLRRLKPEGNLLRDRFRSLMERGVLETRIMPVIAKKRKVKEVEKWSYKDFK